jgi:hypothetical protein
MNKMKLNVGLDLMSLAVLAATSHAANTMLDRAALLKLADNNKGHPAPFAPDCERHENGFRTAPFGGPSLGVRSPAGGPARPPGLISMQDCTSQIDTGTLQYITTIEDRRVEIADTITGLAIGVPHFHHRMTQKKFAITGNPSRQESDMNNQKPFDMPAMHIFKIWGGQIHEMEAIGISLPYNSPTGWE